MVNTSALESRGRRLKSRSRQFLEFHLCSFISFFHWFQFICVMYIYILYAKPSNKRFIIPLQNVILQLASIFWVRVFRNILIPSVRMTSTMSKMFARIICETVE